MVKYLGLNLHCFRLSQSRRLYQRCSCRLCTPLLNRLLSSALGKSSIFLNLIKPYYRRLGMQSNRLIHSHHYRSGLSRSKCLLLEYLQRHLRLLCLYNLYYFRILLLNRRWSHCLGIATRGIPTD